MQTSQQITARPFTGTSQTTLLSRLLQRIVQADARHRQMRRLRDLPPERRRDIGLDPAPGADAPVLPASLRHGW